MTRLLTVVAFSVFAVTLVRAQDQAPNLPPVPANAPPPSLQSPADPGRAAFLAKMCKAQAPAPAAGAGRGGGRGQQGPPPGPREYTVAAIPGVIEAGQRWRFIWQEQGNNGDGIVGTDDAGLLIAQNDNSVVLKLDANGRPSVVHRDTHTGGSLSINAKGAMFVVQRGLGTGILQLEPRRVRLADRYNGEPFDCSFGNPNDLSAADNGGVYFTMGGVYYADAKGVVTKYGEDITPNGIILSADERRLYVTNGPTLAVFDVQADGSLASQREFAKLEGGGNGDGLAIDSMGRIYVTTNPGVQVIGADGKYLGIIPTPRPVISAAIGGKDKRTLYVLARGAKDSTGMEVANAAQVYGMQLVAQGYRGRAK
ncbi:MAG: SMP-30/gluconolactonase/LRE family protein [Acidimicrobiia bacterium]|nr:SMP-30/gluconolactonase/LRE family protein [Acidimicrobiia bacterium]